jgi:3'-phosphoadenosine 5'-phosphosulfate sulfotransferase (PAPS reductase)/FAD synthetase
MEHLALKVEYDKLAKQAKVGEATYPEIGCTTCGRMNDVGNPKIKSCWFCTSPVNYDG